LGFALLGLLIQFIFSYLNQSTNGSKLTFMNFAARFTITMGLILFFIQRMFSNTGLQIFASKSNKVKMPIVLLLAILLVWQMRYLNIYFGMKQTLHKVEFISELFPMSTGFVVTFIIFLSMLKRCTSANMGFQQYRQ